MDERDGVAVGRLDRDAEPVRRHGAREGHHAGARREHGRTGRAADVDASVLAAAYGSSPSRNCRRTGPTRARSRRRAAGASTRNTSAATSDRSQWRQHAFDGRERARRVVKSGYRFVTDSELVTESRGRARSGDAPVSRATSSAACRRGDAGGDELGRRPRRPRPRPVRSPRPPAPSTSVISPFGGSAKRAATSRGRAAHDLLELLRQLAADGDRPLRAAPPASERASPAAAAATRTRPPATASGRAPPTAPRAPPRRAAGSRGTGSARPRTRSRRAPSRPPTAPGQDGHRHARLERGGDQPRARVVDPGQAGVADQRDPLPRLEPRQHLRRRAPPRCARGS